jgi:hypothetical protein
VQLECVEERALRVPRPIYKRGTATIQSQTSLAYLHPKA